MCEGGLTPGGWWLQELHGTGNIPADYRNREEPALKEPSRWLQRNAKLFNKDRLTVNRYRLIKDILGETTASLHARVVMPTCQHEHQVLQAAA